MPERASPLPAPFPIVQPIYLITLNTLLVQGAHVGSRVVASLLALELGANPFTVGLLIGVYAVFPLFLGVYSGRLSDRYGARRPMMAGILLLAVGLALPVLWPLLPVLFVSAALVGTGFALGCSQPLTLNLAYNYSPPGRTGEVTGLRLTINNITHIGVPVAAGGLATALSVGPVFWTSAALLAVGGWLTRKRAD